MPIGKYRTFFYFVDGILPHHVCVSGALQYICSHGGALSAIALILLISSANNTLAGQLRQPHTAQ